MLCPLLALPSVQSMTNTSTISASQSQAGAPLFSGMGVTEKGLFTQGAPRTEPLALPSVPYPYKTPRLLLVQSGQAEGLDFKAGTPPSAAWAPPARSGPWQVPLAEEGSRRCNASRESAAPSSHGDLSFAVGAQVPGSAPGAAVKARSLRAEGLGQLLHAKLAPGRVARPSRRGRGVNRQVAAGCGPDGAAGGPGLVVARWGGAGGGRVARGGPGAGVEQLRQVLGGPPGSRREGQRGGFRGRKTLVEGRGRGLCGDREP